MISNLTKFALLCLLVGVATFLVQGWSAQISSINSFFVGFLWGTAMNTFVNIVLTKWSEN
jgi:hypothetical protein